VDSVVQSCKIRLRPILMTSLATLLGMIPMALGLEAGSEQYAPLARAVIGGLAVSVVVTVFLVPAVYLIVHGRREKAPQSRRRHNTHETAAYSTYPFALIFALTIASAGCLIARCWHQFAATGCTDCAADSVCAADFRADDSNSSSSSIYGTDSAAAGENPRLALSDAEKLAIKNNPRVSVARLLALAQHQVMRETRSAELLLCQIVCPPIRDLANNLHARFISSVQPRFSPN